MHEPKHGLDGKVSYQKYDREIDQDEAFAIHQFDGDIESIPKSIKREMSVHKLERTEDGDWLILRDGRVHRRNEFPLTSAEIKAADWRKVHEIDLSDMEGDFYHPITGEKVLEDGNVQKSIKAAGPKMTHTKLYGKGEEIVIEIGP